MQADIIGWDIGGAHLKAAHIQAKTGAINVYQKPCPLWKGKDKLRDAAKDILSQTTSANILHVITMTGELVDLFAGRDDGVKQILAVMDELLPDKNTMVYTGKDGVLKLADVKAKHYASIASANWLASATWVAQQLGGGLFVDIGSTTTDILLLNDGKVLAEGYSDYERLISQELIYTGIVRTPVMAVAQSVYDQGKRIGVMAEYFATMADVYRITGVLQERHDQTDTADGAEKTASASGRRLARMIGCDYAGDEFARWQRVAENIRDQQLQRIKNACDQQLRRTELGKDRPVIGAGIGRLLVKQIALDLSLPYVDFAELFSGMGEQCNYDVADCAPAVAVACLVAHSL